MFCLKPPQKTNMKQYRDHYFLKAKQEHYPARSIYKLKEIDSRFHIFSEGMTVLDLGASPGSWSLGAAERVGVQGRVLACDLKPAGTDFPDQVSFYQEDIFNRSEAFEKILIDYAPFHVVMSDMAPQTTGTRFTDQARSLELCLEALAVADRYLIRGGTFVVKIFMGPDIMELVGAMRKCFRKVTSFKPKSSRSESKENFYVGIDFAGHSPPVSENK